MLENETNSKAQIVAGDSEHPLKKGMIKWSNDLRQKHPGMPVELSLSIGLTLAAAGIQKEVALEAKSASVQANPQTR